MSHRFQALAERWKGLGAPPPRPDLLDHRARKIARSLLDASDSGIFEVVRESDKSVLYALVNTIRDELVHYDPRGPGDRIAGIRILSNVQWFDDPFGELEELRGRLSLGPLDAISFSSLTVRDSLELIRVLQEEMDVRPAVFLPKCAEVLTDESKQGDSFAGRVSAELKLLMSAGYRLTQEFSNADECLDSAETYLTVRGTKVDLARVGFQRLALSVSRRLTLDVSRASSRLRATFRKHGLIELAMKTDLLLAAALRESGKYSESRRVTTLMVDEAVRSKSAKMLAYGLVGLANTYAVTGDLENTQKFAARAEEALRRFPSPIALAKLHWILGDLFRARGRYAEAELVYRRCLTELSLSKLDAEVAGLRLVLADLFVNTNRYAEAIEEIKEALPAIVGHQLTGESIAAVALLKRSIEKGTVDRSALSRLQKRPKRAT